MKEDRYDPISGEDLLVTCREERDDWKARCCNAELDRDALLGKPEAVHQGALAALACVQQSADLKEALNRSLALQSHYAKLLNMHDGGNRMVFADADEWIARLRMLDGATYL